MGGDGARLVWAGRRSAGSGRQGVIGGRKEQNETRTRLDGKRRDGTGLRRRRRWNAAEQGKTTRDVMEREKTVHVEQVRTGRNSMKKDGSGGIRDP